MIKSFLFSELFHLIMPIFHAYSSLRNIITKGTRSQILNLGISSYFI